MNWSLILGVAIGVGAVTAGLILFGAHLYNESAEAAARREHQEAIARQHSDDLERFKAEAKARRRAKAKLHLLRTKQGGKPAA